MKVNITRLSLVLAASFVFGSAVYGAFGPCSLIANGTYVNTIACTIVAPNGARFCTGTVNITPQQKSCTNTNEDPCTNLANDILVVYTSMNCNGAPLGQCINLCPCSQDLSSKRTTPGGTNC